MSQEEQRLSQDVPEVGTKECEPVDPSLSLTINPGHQFWSEILGSSKFILAPMVDQSELAFRLLVRKYQVQCTYSPMFNSNIFVKDGKYQRDCLQVLPQIDRPFIIQFCANKPELFLKSAEIASEHCDAVDLNLGCPQTIARRGHYGAFLQDEWNLIHDIVKLASSKLSKPVTCKIRVFPDIDKTVQYAKMIESAGASLITVHGRYREQKGPVTGLASWQHIAAIKKAVKVPVFANGNIQSLSDIQKCFEQTKVDGVMSAEGILHNPAIFTGKPIPVWQVTREYIELARKYPCPFSYVRGHVFKFLHHCLSLSEHVNLRNTVAKTHSLDDLLKVADQLEECYRECYNNFIDSQNLNVEPDTLPVFFCKPYYRPPPTEFNSKVEKSNARKSEDENSKPNKKLKSECKPKPVRDLCVQCPNPKGAKCDHECCRQCCRNKSFVEILDCKGHRFIFKSRKLKQLESVDN